MPPPPSTSVPGKVFALVGGLLFAGSLAYFVVSYARFGQPPGPSAPDAWMAVVTNVLLFSVFALHHSVLARAGVKTIIAARVSAALERSVYVWVASLLFVLTLWAWAPVPGTLWRVTGTLAVILDIGRLLGLVLTGLAAAAIDPLELAGVKQAFGRASSEPIELSTTGVYAIVRHPIYLGWVLLVWCMTVMTGTRVVFAAVSTLYLIIAIPFEEREMRRSLGRSYDTYAAAVRWRMIPGLY